MENLDVLTGDLLKDAEQITSVEMEQVVGGVMSGCSACCDSKNGGGSSNEHFKEQDDR